MINAKEFIGMSAELQCNLITTMTLNDEIAKLIIEVVQVGGKSILEMDFWRLLINERKKQLVSYLKEYRQRLKTPVAIPDKINSEAALTRNLIGQSRKRRRDEMSSSLLYNSLDDSVLPFVEVVLYNMFLYGDCENPSVDCAVLLTEYMLSWLKKVISSCAFDPKKSKFHVKVKDLTNINPFIGKLYFRWKKLRKSVHLNDDESKDSDMINNLNAIINEDDGDKEGGGRKEDEGEDKDDDDYTSKGLDDGEDEEAEEDVKMEIELDTDLPEYFVSRLDFADRRTSLMSREEYISYEKLRYDESSLVKSKKRKKQFTSFLSLSNSCSQESLNILGYMATDEIGRVVENCIKKKTGGVLCILLEPLPLETIQIVLDEFKKENGL